MNISPNKYLRRDSVHLVLIQFLVNISQISKNMLTYCIFLIIYKDFYVYKFSMLSSVLAIIMVLLMIRKVTAIYSMFSLHFTCSQITNQYKNDTIYFYLKHMLDLSQLFLLLLNFWNTKQIRTMTFFQNIAKLPNELWQKRIPTFGCFFQSKI